MTGTTTLAEQLKMAHDSMSPAEKRVSRVLIADYPVAGLEPVHRLAERANVSAPTVLRLISKLGIGSYPQMQKLLRGEISARTSSPLEMYGERTAASETGPESSLGFVADSRRVLTEGLDSTFSSIPESEILEITRLLANPRLRIWTVGGRFSNLLAQYLNMHLKLLRKDVQHVNSTEADRTFALMDFGPRDLLIAFDYRRYQDSTVEFLKNAKHAKATTVLFTDPWLSPAAKHADHLLSCSVTAASPFDSLTSAFALVETVIAGVVDELGESPRKRIEAFDALQDRTVRSSGVPLDDN
ncbi:MurR/RpiR family transcriptional regulator [Leifsonia sp. YAF41]|uniref:MurR/RpiR family transcriptional regulator n=1 Tax=Leifsonia sp. YAF41 TaxID=3233086 RepID=UPI003F98C076